MEFFSKKKDVVEAFVRDAMEGKVTPMEQTERKTTYSSRTSAPTGVAPTSTAPRLVPSHAPVQSTPPSAPATQTVTYTLPLPSVGQTVTLVTHGGSGQYQVTEVEAHNGITDVTLVTPKNGPSHTSTLMIVNGRWRSLWDANATRC